MESLFCTALFDLADGTSLDFQSNSTLIDSRPSHSNNALTTMDYTTNYNEESTLLICPLLIRYQLIQVNSFFLIIKKFA